MKTFTVKYEDYQGGCHIETVAVYDRSQVISRLTRPCKEIYWINQTP